MTKKLEPPVAHSISEMRVGAVYADQDNTPIWRVSDKETILVPDPGFKPAEMLMHVHTDTGECWAIYPDESTFPAILVWERD